MDAPLPHLSLLGWGRWQQFQTCSHTGVRNIASHGEGKRIPFDSGGGLVSTRWSFLDEQRFQRSCAGRGQGREHDACLGERIALPAG